MCWSLANSPSWTLNLELRPGSLPGIPFPDLGFFLPISKEPWAGANCLCCCALPGFWEQNSVLLYAIELWSDWYAPIIIGIYFVLKWGNNSNNLKYVGVALGQISKWNCRAMKMLLKETNGLEEHPEKCVWVAESLGFQRGGALKKTEEKCY